jgi:LacI family transcriptional regulator
MARVGIRDVAREAGVSVTTVSLVLNGRAPNRIPEATRERVRQAAEALRYAPNAVARSLRTQQTHTIGLISDKIATTPYAVRMVEAAQDVARENGHLVFLVNTDGDDAIEREAVQALLARQVEGLIYACMWHRAVEPPTGLPAGTVFLDCVPIGGGFRAVAPDDRDGARRAIRALVDAGHRRIAYVDIREDPPPLASGLRHEGYLDVLLAAGIEVDPALHVRNASNAAGGRAAVDELLALPAERRPTGIFCFNDRIAAGAYASARHHGLRIPEDLSVVGYDDQQLIATELDPPLTTVALPHYEMGRWATEVLLGRTTAPNDGDGVLRMPCPLITRASVGPPPASPGKPAGGGLVHP